MPFLSIPHFLFVFAAAAICAGLPRGAKAPYLLFLSWVWFLRFDPRFFFLLAGTTVFDYWAARWLEFPAFARWRAPLLAASVSVNLGIVLFFKLVFYIGKGAGYPSHAPTELEFRVIQLAEWGMPLGVSFFTFHSISYVTDVYRGRVAACRSFVSYALFVSFFPKIAAGPIERFAAFSRQLRDLRAPGATQVLRSLRLLVMGLFLKLVVGDNLSLLVRMNFDVPEHHLFTSAVGMYAFTAQIYADFLGYTLLARGTALLFGIELGRNFASPYLAASLTDFWRRWHVSLSRWFRDYVYIPLGGNRGFRGLHIVMTMALAGFWHGIGFSFLLWGLYHGVLLALSKPFEAGLARLPRLFARLLTFHLVAIGWVFFRAESARQAFDVLAGFFRAGPRLGPPQAGQIALLLWLVLPWILAARFHRLFRRARPQRWYVAADTALMGTSLLLVVVFGSISAVPFLYFKF